MPDLGNISLSATRYPNIKPLSAPPDFNLTSVEDLLGVECNWGQKLRFQCLNENEVVNGSGIRVLRRSRPQVPRTKRASNSKGLKDHVKDWVFKSMEVGVPESRCCLPFLVGAKKMVECLLCHCWIYPDEEVLCSVRGCQGVYHLNCVKERLGISNKKKFKCPQHACFVCKQKLHWRCVRCIIAAHDKCAPWPDDVIHLKDQPGKSVCWRHPTDWRLDRKVNFFFPSSIMSCRLADRTDEFVEWQHTASIRDMEEVFRSLPLPYSDEEFKIDLTWKDVENKVEPPSYLHIRRNIYLVKKKRDDAYDGPGCTNCDLTCSKDCVCRVQCISCSKSCRCTDTCKNRPFRKEKKVKIVKTELCGWGVEAAEFINKGDFIIEYIGEVIDDAQCEKRLWQMKYKGEQNFYMCELRKDFTIDATYKGNQSRFLNHSCDPNCVLEKWQVDGETRVGVFAARSIDVGEPLTYDYRFVQFGPEVRCQCGASNCQGYLGAKRRVVGKVELCWGSKRKRTSTACIAVITV